jgi:hypothetical protein
MILGSDIYTDNGCDLVVKKLWIKSVCSEEIIAWEQDYDFGGLAPMTCA